MAGMRSNRSGCTRAGLARQRVWQWRRRVLAVELWHCLVFAMIVVGGATRLTDSGLSITEWKPILGAIPPLNEADWLAAFEKYKQIPEYHLVNKGMALADFKFIFWWEWSHRFLGRMIGVAFALPLLAFWMTGRLRAGLPVKMLGVLALGGFKAASAGTWCRRGSRTALTSASTGWRCICRVAMAILALVVWLALDERAARIGRPYRRPRADGDQRLARGSCSG